MEQIVEELVAEGLGDDGARHQRRQGLHSGVRVRQRLPREDGERSGADPGRAQGLVDPVGAHLLALGDGLDDRQRGVQGLQDLQRPRVRFGPRDVQRLAGVGQMPDDGVAAVRGPVLDEQVVIAARLRGQLAEIGQFAAQGQAGHSGGAVGVTPVQPHGHLGARGRRAGRGQGAAHAEGQQGGHGVQDAQQLERLVVAVARHRHRAVQQMGRGGRQPPGEFRDPGGDVGADIGDQQVLLAEGEVRGSGAGAGQARGRGVGGPVQRAPADARRPDRRVGDGEVVDPVDRAVAAVRAVQQEDPDRAGPVRAGI
ncbi:hypothetical protein [Streptomyces sp. CoT10]|uniref:hypothetical protein n=1 Tax=Streptomyces sp. CoT10 TaxID=2875762 RepID=UPI001CD6BBC8|nr:hypothetical protein [Streptomyces sp. CoT10]